MARTVVASGTRVAILAGGGELPLLIADRVVARGGDVHIVAIAGEADPAAVARYPHTFVNLAQAGRMFAALRGDGEKPPQQNLMVFAGTVTRPDLATLRPDFGLVPVVIDLLGFITAGGDDALLTKAIRLFERRGLTVVGVQDVAPELLVGEGTLGRYQPDSAAQYDLQRAADVLHALGEFDVGQGVVAEGGRIVAIEGVEGTDRMLARVAADGATKRGVLLKAPKPRQERRVDLPTIGVRTIENAKQAGLIGVAVTAGQSIGLQREAMVQAADASGLFVIGLPTPVAAAPPGPEQAPMPPHRIDSLSRVVARLGDMADVERGTRAVTRLAAFGTGQAAAVVRGHVLGLSAAEALEAFVARQARAAPWGLGRFRRRRGAIVIRALANDGGADAAALARLAADAGFAALAFVVGARGPGEPFRAAALAADRAGLALIAVRLVD